MEGNQYTGAKSDLRAIRIFCIAMIAGVGVFALVILLVVDFKTGPVLDPGDISKLGDVVLAFSAALALVCFFFATRNYRRAVLIARDKFTLPDKLSEFRKGLMLYMGTCEAPAIFGIIGFFLTGNYYLLAITAFMLGAMLWKAPFGKKYISELDLDWQETV